MMADKDAVERMTLRLPLDVYATLKAWAKDEGRSMHAQVLYLLRQAIKERQP